MSASSVRHNSSRPRDDDIAKSSPGETHRIGASAKNDRAKSGVSQGQDPRENLHPKSATRHAKTERVDASPAQMRRGQRALSNEDRDSDHHADEAVDINENGGRHGLKQPGRQSSGETNTPPRLLVVSNKVKNGMIVNAAILPNVVCVHYKFDNATMDSLLSSISQHLSGKLVESVAFMLHSSASVIHLTGRDDKIITKESISESQTLRDFLSNLARQHLDKSWSSPRLDFLACSLAEGVDAKFIAGEIEDIVRVPVAISKDLTGAEIISNSKRDDCSICVGELYFKMEKLRSWGNNQQSLAGFEKIRTVGKGAYGTAVLYRKKDDDSIVILKEINLHDLTAAERQMALNEVQVLSMLDHPYIISYYDSFEEDGIVMIEMEYADGGTLAQYLAQQDKPLEEREILQMFSQMVSALKYIHEHHVLHRDLKTANIFLTKDGRVKVGDFGISKMMSTANGGANTVLGTPYYISPEMCESKPYNDKSDIWALGCILYEMACLQKTFEGSNLPALVNKIMKGQFAPVKGDYSQELKALIMEMLQREPEYRPSASELWHNRLPELLSRFQDDPVTDYEEDMMSSENTLGRKKKISSNASSSAMENRSVLYYFEMAKQGLHPVVLPSRTKIRDVAVGRDHVIVVTSERMVYTWGEGSKGQLGHGVLESCAQPRLVEALKGKSIIKTCCGDSFSVFGSDNGIIMTCGDGTYGCLGHGDWSSTSRPRLIEALLSVDVVSVSCGSHHVVCVGSEGEVFSWGRGTEGQLGLNSDDNQCQPTEVAFDENVCIRQCFCGRDGTMLLTDVGSVLACGNNEYNKLGLNQRQGFLMAMKNIFNKIEVAGEHKFTTVRALARHRVISIAMGPNHSAVIVEPGHVYTLGRNTDGQLGIGNTKPQNAPCCVKIFEEKFAQRIGCGEYYTVSCTTSNEMLFWGTRFKNPVQQLEDSWGRSSQPDMRVESAGSSRSHSRSRSDLRVDSAGSRSQSNTDVRVDNPGSRSHSNSDMRVESAGSRSHSRQPSTNSLTSVKDGECRDGPRGIAESSEGQTKDSSGGWRHGDKPANSSDGALSPSTTVSGGFRPLSSTPRRIPSASSNGGKDRGGGGGGGDKDGATRRDDCEVILQPTALLRMDSSGSRSSAGDTVTLSKFFCHGENLFIQVETTAPPPKRRSRKRRYLNSRRRLTSPGRDPSGSSGNILMSASSRDGGDEYSSEASEIDTSGTHKRFFEESRKTSFISTTQIPTWLKAELADSANVAPRRRGNHPTDTSDRSDDEEEEEEEEEEDETSSPIVETSMSSIHINRNLKHGMPDTKPGRKPGKTRDADKSATNKASSSSNKKSSSVESGIDGMQVDPLSSSSSSETMAPALHSKPIEKPRVATVAPVMMKKPSSANSSKRAPPAGVSPPTPYKSKTLPQQKPLNRIRAQGKTRRSDTSRESISKTAEAEAKLRQENLELLQTELAKLREEKRATENRLKEMEELNRKQQHRQLEVKLKSNESEIELKQEIISLRTELKEQGNKLQDNFNVVLSLQEQLVKVQTEQQKMSVKEQPRPDSRQSRQSQRESRICVIQ